MRSWGKFEILDMAKILPNGQPGSISTPLERPLTSHQIVFYLWEMGKIEILDMAKIISGH